MTPSPRLVFFLFLFLLMLPWGWTTPMSETSAFSWGVEVSQEFPYRPFAYGESNRRYGWCGDAAGGKDSAAVDWNVPPEAGESLMFQSVPTAAAAEEFSICTTGGDRKGTRNY
jgi:hypothetical protein